MTSPLSQPNFSDQLFIDRAGYLLYNQKVTVEDLKKYAPSAGVGLSAGLVGFSLVRGSTAFIIPSLIGVGIGLASRIFVDGIENYESFKIDHKPSNDCLFDVYKGLMATGITGIAACTFGFVASVLTYVPIEFSPATKVMIGIFVGVTMTFSGPTIDHYIRNQFAI